MVDSIISPAVVFTETDNTQVGQSQSSDAFAFVGRFDWGPVNKPMTVSNSIELKNIFGKPNAGDSGIDFLVAEDFLSYSSTLRVLRVGASESMKNATSSKSGTKPAIFSDEDFETDAGLNSILWIAKYPGELGNSIGVSTCANTEDFEETLPGTFTLTRGSKIVGYTASSDEGLEEYFDVDDYLIVDGTRHTVVAIDSDNDTLTLARIYAGKVQPEKIARGWRFSTHFAGAPDNSSIHVVITDTKGQFTGEAGKILEIYENLESEDQSKKFADGTFAYYKTAINRRSSFIRVGGASIATDQSNGTLVELSGGATGYVEHSETELDSVLIDGYEIFDNKETIDIRGFIMGSASPIVSSFVIENICADRRDCGAFVSPRFSDVVNNRKNEVSACRETRRQYPYLSYGVMDNNWMKVLDRYNNVYRWIPCNGGSAGCLARVIREQGVGFSPAGDDAGRINNAIKLAWSPSLSQRNDLYVDGINSIAEFEGKGALLYGDRTLLGDVGSAFRQIGFRWLFIYIEKTVANAATSVLFKFNDDVTRAHFVSLVEPILRRLQGSRVVVTYRIIVDETVNTDTVVNAEEFVGVIEVQGARSINGVRLDFVANNAGAEFTESTL